MKIKLLPGLVFLALIFTLSFQGASVAGSDDKAAKAAPDFTLNMPGGGTCSLAGYKGKENVILMFWTINGAYCSFELEGMRDKYSEVKKNNFEIIAINIKEESAKVKDFVLKEKLTFPVILDTDGKVAKMYSVRSLPVFLIINKEGQIKWRGYTFPTEYLKLVNKPNTPVAAI